MKQASPFQSKKSREIQRLLNDEKKPKNKQTHKNKNHKKQKQNNKTKQKTEQNKTKQNKTKQKQNFSSNYLVELTHR